MKEPIDISNVETLMKLANISKEELSKLFKIPMDVIEEWIAKPDENPRYIIIIMYSALINEGYFKNNIPLIKDDPRYTAESIRVENHKYNNELNTEIIDVRWWKQKNPTLLNAMVKMLPCGQHALLLEKLPAEICVERAVKDMEMYKEEPSIMII